MLAHVQAEDARAYLHSLLTPPLAPLNLAMEPPACPRLPGTGVDPDEERRVLCEREGLEDDAVDHILALQQELPSARMRDAQRAHEARQNRAAGGEDEDDEVDGGEVTDALLPKMTGEGAVSCLHPPAQPACLQPAPQLDVDSSSGGDAEETEADGATGYHALVSDSEGEQTDKECKEECDGQMDRKDIYG